jgi:peptidoglycan hydrolase-like protein with peptidoglycan-binding domain
MAIPETVRNGDSGETVFYVQYELVRAHLFQDGIAVDGEFGPITEAAVVAFQTSEGIDADGIVGPITWGRFLAHHPLPPTLQVGSTGAAVAGLQSALNQWGSRGTWEMLDVDGDFGPKTELAVKILQKAAEIDLDGIVGPQTWSQENIAELAGV